MEKDNISWKRMRFKTNKVWLALDEDGHPLVKKNKVLIKYQLQQDYEYWVNPKSLQPIPAVNSDNKSILNQSIKDNPNEPLTNSSKAVTRLPPNGHIIEIFTDGASSGNPGPSGIGVVMRFGNYEKEISRHIGIATNNIAELEAIRAGLLELKKTSLPIRVFTDSHYAYGVLVLGWKTKKNKELIHNIKKLIATFDDLEIVPVRGHHGVEGNERADKLATKASQRM